jgi:hydroxymethylglutaryl-CoA reductase
MMNTSKHVAGFSKLSKDEKIQWIANEYFSNPQEASKLIKSYWNSDPAVQQLHDDFIENTITNFYLPLGIAPNFLINGRFYTVPMAIEESSVVAAASKSAKYWAARGGFKTTIIDTEKVGQVHFSYAGEPEKLITFFNINKHLFFEATQHLTANMQKRGGGIRDIVLVDKSDRMEGYWQLHATFETRDSMGANFINSCLEQFARTLQELASAYPDFSPTERNIEIVMSILSNYIPNCIVKAEVRCPVSALADKNISDPEAFAHKFIKAVRIAEIEPYRAVTHNKGIMNGVDAVVLATGNDFRAVEAGIHAYASRNGTYTSLSYADIKDGQFTFGIELPLALGTVGGLTSLHPLVTMTLQMLENPSAQELMQIVAAAGLAQNFAALRSLTTTGIQEGHMKMHLNNIINQFDATAEERALIIAHFKKNPVSHAAVVSYINGLRNTDTIGETILQ